MRRFTLLVGLIVCIQITAVSQLPPVRPFSTHQWKNYSQNLLNKILKDHPEDQDLLKKVRVRVINQKFFDISGIPEKQVIEAQYDFLRVLDSEDMYAFVLAHEFGHIKFDHRFNKMVWLPTGEIIPDYKSLEQDELQADEFAFLIVVENGYDRCAPLRIELCVLSKFKTSHQDFDSLSEDTRQRLRIFEKRIEMAKLFCRG